ncbi:glutathione S-transferase [Saccharata proteae CBS 121410]|uniref:Glutathione S-transferase n=1 Tax=Saccharata proteae CBS 121410 TaxID=1314787 RepID=A0A9P4LY19_9PEZI|nr:glutathione S-transferase [Saccharata proteae CBS 121410]
MSNPRPSGLIANKGIELLTFGTPNGHKASIILEELKEAYGKDYVFQSIPIMENIQKEPWFTKLGPNGRIPVIVDHDNDGFSVQEGSAILAYLTRQYDPEKRFTFTDDKDLSRAEQWVAWQHGGLGPMQGQANHFYRLAKERIPYPTQRYVGETERLYGILDSHLADRDFIVGPGRGKYSIADIANFSWVNVSYFAGVDLKQFPNLHKWWERVNERPAVQKGTTVPGPSQIVNKRYQERLKEEPEFKQKEEELAELCRKAKEQYGYKYSSP